MTIVLVILHLFFVAWLFSYRKLYIEGVSKYYSLAYFLLKCICGYVMFLIYHNYFHQGDVFSYLNDTEIFYRLLKENPSSFFKAIIGVSNDYITGLHNWNEASYNAVFSDNRTVILLNVLIRFISFGSVEVHIIWMNVLSYIGLVWIFRSIQSGFQTIKNNWFIFIPFFLPSVLTWGSALSKEPLMLFVLGALIHSLQLYFADPKRTSILKVIASMLLFCFIKSYILILLLPGILAWIILSKMKSWKASFVFSSIYIIGLLELLIAGNFFSSFNLPEFLFGQQLSNIRYAIMFSAKGIINPVLFAPTALGFLHRIPEAIAFAFFHPFISELNQWWMIPLALEPYFLILLFIYQLKMKNEGLKNISALAWLTFYAAIMLLIILGFTIPVLGTLARLKMPAFLLLSIALAVMLNQKRKEA